MLDSKPFSLPLVAGYGPDTRRTDSEDTIDNIPYAKLFGCVLYAMICTRPDLIKVGSLSNDEMTKDGI